MTNKSIKGLVLSGGGAKGAYEIGCWRAFLELNIDFDIVSGTSIGALNAALYCEGNYSKSIEFWRSLYSVPDFIHFHNALETLIERSQINEEAIRQSDKELIITTFDENTSRPAYYKLSNIPNGHLRKIIRASMSCCSPVFGPVDIGRKLHTDAGKSRFGDNTPIMPVYESGAKKIIVVYLEPQKQTNKEEFPNAIILDIVPEQNLGAILKFNDEKTLKLIEKGYNDAMELFKNKRKGERNGILEEA